MNMFYRFSKKKSKPLEKKISAIVHNKTLLDKLIFNPELFSFVKAVDVATSVTKYVNLNSKINYSSKFSDVSLVDGIKDGNTELYTNIQGIAGIEGGLPDSYVEEYITQNRKSKKAVADFFDIFNNRILTLRYTFMKKHDIPSVSMPIEKTAIGNIIFSLSGFNVKEKNEKLNESLIPEQFKISCQNLFWKPTRTSEGIRIILSNFFDVPVEIEQFYGGFTEADKSLQTTLGVLKNRFNKLGVDSILGNKVWNSANGIKIIIGLLNFKQYIDFLPKNSKFDQKVSKLQKIKEIIKTYVPVGIDVKIQFYLDKCFVKETLLNGVNRLNKDSFIFGNHSSNETCFMEQL